jgi:hypothetical protein
MTRRRECRFCAECLARQIVQAITTDNPDATKYAFIFNSLIDIQVPLKVHSEKQERT